MDFQLNRDIQNTGQGTHEAAHKRGMSVAGNTAAMGNQSRLQNGLLMGTPGLGNQGVIQFHGEGTYANAQEERARLSASHGGADTSGAHFQIEHALGFQSANPLNRKRSTVKAYEGILFAYAEIYLAHRLHIGTGKNVKNYRVRNIKSVSVPEETLNGVLECFEAKIQEFVEQKKEEIQAIVTPVFEAINTKFAGQVDIKLLQGFLIPFLDQWTGDIGRLVFTFFQMLPEEFRVLFSDTDMQHCLEDVLMERLMSALFKCLQTLLGFTNIYEPNVMPTKDRGFDTDDDYRDHQRTAVYDDGHMGNAVQLNQLGYARIYQYYTRRGFLNQTEIEIANDSFLWMVENMFEVQVMESDLEEASELPKIEDVPLRTIQVTPEERCEMVLSRLAMIHGQWPDVCAEALVRYHVIGRHDETRSAVLELLNLGRVGDLALPVICSPEFMDFFKGTEIFPGICAELALRQVYIESYMSNLDPLFAELPTMPVRQMIDLMQVFLTVKAQDEALLGEICTKMFGDAPVSLLRQAFGADEPSLECLMEVVDFIKGYRQCAPDDRIYWFGRYIRQASFQFCLEVICQNEQFSLEAFWEIIVKTALSFAEADNLEILWQMLMSIFQGADLELISQSTEILQAIRQKLDEGEDQRQEFWQETAPFLTGILMQAERIPDIHSVAADLLASFVKEPEEGGTDYGKHTLDAFGENGEAFIQMIESDNPGLIAQAVMEMTGTPLQCMLPSLIDRIKNADALASACLMIMEVLVQGEAEETFDLLLLRLMELGKHTVISPELLAALITNIGPDMSGQLCALAFCLISQVKLINQEDFFANVSRLLAEKTMASGLGEDPEMRTVFKELIKYGLSKGSPGISACLIRALPNPENWAGALLGGDPKQIVFLMRELALSGEAWGWDLITLSLESEEVFEAATAFLASLLSSEEFKQQPAMSAVFMELFQIGLKKNYIDLCLRLIHVLPGDPAIWVGALVHKKRDAIMSIMSMLAQADAAQEVWCHNLALAFLLSCNDLPLLLALLNGSIDYGGLWDSIIKAFSTNPLTIQMVGEQDQMILEMTQIALIRSNGRDIAMDSLRELIGGYLSLEGLPESFIQFLKRMGALPA